MLLWIATLFGFEPTRQPASLDSTAPKDPRKMSVNNLKWAEGPQVRKEIRFSEPAGWDHTNWAWHSIGYINRPGSRHPQVDRAECRLCLGVLKCRDCKILVRPNTKSRGMIAQLMGGCLDAACHGVLERMHCEARIYRFVEVEDGVRIQL